MIAVGLIQTVIYKLYPKYRLKNEYFGDKNTSLLAGAKQK